MAGPLQKRIQALDEHIDRLVYELYGLTEDEIRVVEVGTHAGHKLSGRLPKSARLRKSTAARLWKSHNHRKPGS
jgi:hypothetical protein